MSDIWIISDHHFSHANMLKFTNSDGGRIRPEFDDVTQMNEYMIQMHNQTVKPTDKVYFLGDVSFDKKGMDGILSRLNGHKRLILGNHDTFHMSAYIKHFDKIMTSWRGLRGDVIFTHHPLRLADGSNEKIRANVHGHIHRAHINDPRYFNVSVEVLDYIPIHVEDIFMRLKTLGVIQDKKKHDGNDTPKV